MSEHTDRPNAWAELSRQELEQIRGGENLTLEPVPMESQPAPYQGKRSTSGYVPT